MTLFVSVLPTPTFIVILISILSYGRHILNYSNLYNMECDLKRESRHDEMCQCMIISLLFGLYASRLLKVHGI